MKNKFNDSMTRYPSAIGSIEQEQYRICLIGGKSAMEYDQKLKATKTQYLVTTVDHPSALLKLAEMAILVHHQFAPHVRGQITSGD